MKLKSLDKAKRSGVSLPKRKTKTAQGLTFNVQWRERKPRWEKSRFSDDARKLSIFGTTDSLARVFNMKIMKVDKEHPNDRGYIKTVYVLSDSGRSRLRALRYERNLRLNIQ